MAQISIIGTLGKDPELEHGQNGGKAYTRLSLAWSESTKDQGGHWVDGPTVWLQVTAFGRVAENVVRSLHKGDRVVVTGRVKPETWTNRQSGESSTVLTVVADTVAPELTFASVQVAKNPKGGQQSGGWSGGGSQQGGGWNNQQAQQAQQQGGFGAEGDEPPFDTWG